MNYIKRKLFKWFLRSFQREIKQLDGNITKTEQDSMLSAMYQNRAFRKYLVSQETAIVLAMANENKKPSDEEYLINYGRRLQLIHLHNEARLGYNRRQQELKLSDKSS